MILGLLSGVLGAPWSLYSAEHERQLLQDMLSTHSANKPLFENSSIRMHVYICFYLLGCHPSLPTCLSTHAHTHTHTYIYIPEIAQDTVFTCTVT
ncbi:hypothetical protein F5Y12DRAFT_728722, partial [Xylaria sp. FL1777]